MPTAQEILARRKAAVANARTGKVPTNAPANVPPAQTPRKIEPLGRKTAAAPVMDIDDDDDGDEAPVMPQRKSAQASTPLRKGGQNGTATSKSSDALGPRNDRMAKRALAVRGATSGGALAQPGLVPIPSRTMTAADTVIPRLKICQAMSKVNTDGQVPMGHFYRSPQNKSLGEKLLVVVVDWSKTRSYFEQGQGVLCRSFDLIKGEGEPGMLCEGTPEEKADPTLSAEERGCPLRLWSEEEGRRIPPPCGEAYNYPVLILDKDDPFEGRTMMAIMSLRSSALKTGKQMNTIVMDEQGDWPSIVLELTVTRQSNTRGTFFVPAVEFHGANAGTTLKKARKFAANYTGTTLRRSVEADKDD